MDITTYVFAGSRIDKLQNSIDMPEEFFYGYQHLVRRNVNVKIIEFHKSKMGILNLIDKVLSKFLSLPFSTARLINYENLKKFTKSKNIILVNENVGMSALPMLIISKFFKKINVYLFVMGLYSKKKRFRSFKFIHNLMIKLLVSQVDYVFFLGKGELEIGKKIHKNHKKLVYFPFAVDENFWRNEYINSQDQKNLIFVGNDGNRNPEIINQLALHFKEFNFKVVSELSDFDKNIDNLEIKPGNWKSNKITDIELKNLYLESKITLIPLHESSQPSGQSVALQSMFLGIPVVISKTKGFWDEDIFINNKNIFFVENNTLEGWVDKINEIYHDNVLLNKVSKNALEICQKNFSLKHFNSQLMKYID